MPLFQLSGSHFFPLNALTLTIDTQWDWEFNLDCNSANHRKRVWVLFPAILVLWLQEMVSFTAQIEASRSFMWHLNWEFEAVNSFLSPLCSDSRSNQPISLYSLVFQKYLKVSYVVIQLLAFISGWLGALMVIFCVSLLLACYYVTMDFQYSLYYYKKSLVS